MMALFIADDDVQAEVLQLRSEKEEVLEESAMEGADASEMADLNHAREEDRDVFAEILVKIEQARTELCSLIDADQPLSMETVADAASSVDTMLEDCEDACRSSRDGDCR
jgi:hypothetical protein